MEKENSAMKVGVALGGGGARGLAHVLALETLDACGIRPTVMAGTSMGAIVGALYASGQTGKQIRENILSHVITRADRIQDIYDKRDNLFKWLGAVHLSASNSGLLNADGFLHYLLAGIPCETFEALEIPLHVVATDFYRGEAVVFNTGPLFPAIKASMSIPGIFVPVKHEGKVLVDGGVVNNLPYSFLLDKCDVTIAIDVAPTRIATETKLPSLVDATLGMFDILVDQVTSSMLTMQPPTIYIRPQLIGIRTLDFEQVEAVFEQAQPAMVELNEKLAATVGLNSSFTL